VLCQAESSVRTTEEEIDIARQIWHIEEIAKAGDNKEISRLKNYLKSSYPLFARIAARQLGYLGTSAAEDALRSIKGDSSNLSIKVSLAKLEAKDKQEAINSMLQLLDDPGNTPAQRHRLRDEIASLFAAEGWVEELELYFKDNPQTTYAHMRSDISDLSFSDKKRFLDNALLNFKTPFEYEAAIRLMAEEIKKDEIPFILEMLGKLSNIPIETPPPYNRTHTNYHILITVLKSIPDQRSVPLLTELSSNGNEYVSSEAQEALQWVISDVPFPIKYLRLLLESDER